MENVVVVWYVGVFKELLERRSLQQAGVCCVSSGTGCWSRSASFGSVQLLCVSQFCSFEAVHMRCITAIVLALLCDTSLFLQYLELTRVWLWFYVNNSFWASSKNKRVSSMFSFQPRGSQNQMTALNSAYCFFVSLHRIFTAALWVASFHFLMGSLLRAALSKPYDRDDCFFWHLEPLERYAGKWSALPHALKHWGKFVKRPLIHHLVSAGTGPLKAGGIPRLQFSLLMNVHAAESWALS